MGESNRARILYVAESTWGETPATPTMIEVLRTGGSLQGKTETALSNVVRNDRMRNKVYRTGKSASGSIEVELAYGQLADFLEAGLCGTWSSPVALTAADISVATADDSYNSAASAFVSAGVQANMWVLFGGFASSANNGYKRVLTVTAGKVTVADNLTTETAPAAGTLKNAGMLRNGTTARSFTLETGHLDLSSVFFYYRGMRVASLGVNIAAGGLVTATVAFEGKSFATGNATLASVVTAANSNFAYNAAEEIADVFEGGYATETTDEITALNFSVNNNLRRRKKITQLEAAGIPYGVQDVSGELDFYLANLTTITKYVNFTETSQSVRVTNGTTDLSLIFSWPALKYTGDLPDAGGLDGDVMAKLPWAAYSNGTYQMQVDRIAG